MLVPFASAGCFHRCSTEIAECSFSQIETRCSCPDAPKARRRDRNHATSCNGLVDCLTHEEELPLAKLLPGDPHSFFDLACTISRMTHDLEYGILSCLAKHDVASLFRIGELSIAVADSAFVRGNDKNKLKPPFGSHNPRCHNNCNWRTRLHHSNWTSQLLPGSLVTQSLNKS